MQEPGWIGMENQMTCSPTDRGGENMGSPVFSSSKWGRGTLDQVEPSRDLETKEHHLLLLVSARGGKKKTTA